MAASWNVTMALLVTLSSVFVRFVEPCDLKGTTLICTNARASMELTFNLCQRKPSVDTKIDAGEHHLENEYELKEGVIKILVGEAMGGIVFWGVGVVKVSMTSRGHGKADISVSGPFGYSGPVEETCSQLKYWFNSQNPLTLKAVGSALLITTTAMGTVCFLAFCRRKRAKRTTVTDGGEPLIPVRDSNDNLDTILPSRDWRNFLEQPRFLGQPQAATTNGEPQAAATIGEPQATSTIGEPQAISTIGEPQVTSTIGKLQVTSTIGKSQATSTIGKSQATSTIGQPELPNTIGQSELPNTIGQSELPNTVIHSFISFL